MPEALRPWQAWVAAKHPDLACPSANDGSVVCVAYGSLKLDLGDQGGSFTQSVAVFGEHWVELPGSADAWPAEVKDGNAQVSVVMHDGRPQARLPQGEHTLAGRFSWSESPPSLRVPPFAALLSLRLKGREIAAPELGGGALQLGAPARRDTGEAEAPVTLRVYRKLTDDIPMRLETFLAVSVSGREREIVTGRFLPERSAVLSIESDLPMRIQPDGRLRAQLRSGEHSIRVASRFLEPVKAVTAVRLDSLWPDQEIWSFEAKQELRVAELSGAPLIDPSQSGLPEEWKNLPAYRMRSGDTLRIQEKQRGNAADQSGNLDLRRQMWLDFSGKAFTIKDLMHGSLPIRSRLEMEGGYVLGRADVRGRPVMITALDGKAGIEVPAGGLDLVALSRFERKGAPLSATGWNRPVQSVNATLHLPPGWKLIHAEGPDGVGNSWISQWSLWDVFLLCILTLATARLAGIAVAALALACFTLLSQESGIPGLLWLNALAAIGLWKVLPQGRLRRAADLYRIASLALIAAIWIPFAVAHARKALYPQLDGPGSTSFSSGNSSLLTSQGSYGSDQVLMKLADREPSPASPAMQEAAPPAGEPQESAEGLADEPAAKMKSPRKESSRLGGRRGTARGMFNENQALQEPQDRFSEAFSKVQSGPGEPEWNWESASLYWSGPVQASENLKLIMTRPWLTRILRALQAILPGALLLLLAFPGAARRWRGAGPSGGTRGPSFAGPAAAAVLLLAVSSARADFPPETLLQDLEARLTAPRPCSPACASMGSGLVTVSGDHLTALLTFDVADTSLAPLPRAGEGQLSLQALREGAKPAAGAVKLPNGNLAIALPRGRHAVTLEGRILGPRLELNFGDQARNLSVQAPGWSVQGLSHGLTEGGALILQRREAGTAAHAGPELTPDPIPPYVEVERTLVLDQEWTLETRVIRLAPQGGAFTVEVPLLGFEHPTTPGMAESRGAAVVSLQEGQRETGWHSVVDRAAVLKLVAGALGERTETWSVAASSRWHVEAAGVLVIASREGGEPVWRPLPGDTLSLSISEPAAATGPVKTIESADLTLTPGKREGAATLRLRVRAGQGDVTRVTLPPGARLETLTLDNLEGTPTQREGTLAIPLHPGLQDIALSWKQPEGARVWQKTPDLRLEDPAANVSLGINVPSDRWILWVGGNAVGPALLLWGVLAVLFVIAWFLGRSRLTPLGPLDWALLFLGTSMVNLYATAPLLAMFLALRYRERHAVSWPPATHNLFQILCAGLAIVGFGMLLAAVPEGLLSAPDMQVTGNGSYGGALRWFLDRTQGRFPSGRVFSLPLWVYRLAMLAWSLWLARRLLQWLRWSWDRYSAGGFWKEPPPRKPIPAPKKEG